MKWPAFTLLAVLAIGRAAGAREVTVAADGSGTFPTVQEAVDAAPEGGVELFVIHLKPGRYREKLTIPKTKGPLQLRGDDAATTVLTYDDHAEQTGDAQHGTVWSASTAVLAELFSAENVTFENSFGAGTPALAINVVSNHATFRRCRFLGRQDTAFLKSGSQYFADCYFEGGVDYLFGAATAFFERCELHCAASGAITAASTPENQVHGFVFSHCKITAAPGVTRIFLGRPWRPFASVTYLDTEMPEAVTPEGWGNWSDPAREKTARYAEYRSTGPGAHLGARAPWSHQLTDAQAATITPQRVLGWNPDGGLAPERLATLPPAEQAAWFAYLERSAERRRNDQAALDAELKKAGLAQPITVPAVNDFKLDPHWTAEWFGSTDAAALADAVMSFQTPSGGWAKHIAFDKGPRAPCMNYTSDAKPWHYAGTIDNGATTSELALLARIYQATGREPCRAAFLKGLDYLLEAQYPTGGWPQCYPLEGSYHDEITFNDDANVHVLELLRAVAAGQPEVAFVDAPRRVLAAAALERGIACILRCQYVQNGRKTVWCAQHDPLTFVPTEARLKEPASLSGGESVGVVRFLMGAPAPSPAVVSAIEDALAWFERSEVNGVRIVTRDGNRVYEPDPAATTPCWARFYDLRTNLPIFAGGQDGIVYNSFAEMANHNATSYDYLTARPLDLLQKDEPRWRQTRPALPH